MKKEIVKAPPQYLIVCDWSCSQVFFHKLTWEEACKCATDDEYQSDYIEEYKESIGQNHSSTDWIFARRLGIFFTNLSSNEIEEAINLAAYPKIEELYTNDKTKEKEYE